ncbi:putative RNA-directed DNA polymerase [Tanacetum coccineum]
MLTRSNYAAWAIKMRVHLSKDSRGSVVVTGREETAKDAWETLKTMFMGADRVKTAKVQTLKAEFETLNMKDTEIIDDFAMKVNNIVSNIRALREKVEEAYVVKKLLRAVPSKFLQIASTIEQFADLDNMTVEEVIGRNGWRDLRRREMKNKRPHNATLDQVRLIIEVEEEAVEEISRAHLWVHDKNGKLLIKVNRSPNRLYRIVLNEVEPHCLFGEHKEHSWLWHSRLGHINFQKIKEMCDKNLVHGLKAIEKPDALCKGCLEGKQTHNPYPTQTLYKAKERLELIHADICGPISPPTPAGNRYFFLLVDDFSRVMWVYMLKSKDEALGMFQKFRVLVENETGVKVKTLRTDRGGEFNSKAFTEYCDDTGLKHHFTAPYSPQQNGVVERRNRSVIEMARSMMKSMQVPDTLWGEAVRQAVYIQNRVPTKTLGDTTPYERWSGKKPNLEHLRVFGCIAYSKVLRGRQQKLDSRSEMLVHLGTETGSKAYRLLDPVSGRIRVSRDVRFEEGKQWLWAPSLKKVPEAPSPLKDIIKKIPT